MPPTHYEIDINNQVLSQKSILYKTEGYVHGSNNLINQEYKIEEKNLNAFLSKINSIKIDSSINHTREILLDGIGFRYSTIDSWNDSISLISTSPIRTNEFMIDYKLLDAFFDLTDKTIKNHNKGQSVTENIQDYFDYDLSIKIISQKPIEFRISGSVSDCGEGKKTLINLFDSLPNNEPIIFDLRNGRLSECLSGILGEYSNNKDLYFYGDFELNQNNLDLEVLQEQLQEAEKDNVKGQVGKIKVSIKEYMKERNKIIERINSDANIFRTRAELMKTIANTGYSK